MQQIKTAISKIPPYLKAWTDAINYRTKNFFWAPFDRELKNSAVKLRGFKDKYKGQRCFLMGNGPSLNKMDLDLFKDETVWGSNKCFLLFDRIKWRPSFYVAVDKRVVRDTRLEINQIIMDFPKTQFFFPSRFHFTKTISSAENVTWFRELPRDMSRLPFGVFSVNATTGVKSVFTVTVAMLQLAVFLGFNPIYLIGCDTNYSVGSTTTHEDVRGHWLVSTVDDDRNHFSPNYFGKDAKWTAPSPEKMIWLYGQAKMACVDLGIEIYNATVGGKLEVFPRVDYRDLF